MVYIILFGCIGLVSGFIIGMCITWSIVKKNSFGTILITKSDDGGLPYLSLDMDRYPNEFEDNDIVTFRTKIVDPFTHQ